MGFALGLWARDTGWGAKEASMIVHTQAFARAGLIGNPSDGYFGKTISFIIKNFSANVTLYESPRLTIRPQACDRLEFATHGALVEDVRQHGYYGGIRLIKATIKRFGDYCAGVGVPIDRNFSVEYETDIPIRVGLAGSSAIITATMRALIQFFGVEIPQPVLPGVILSVELDELKIGAGLQDRVIQVYEGTVFMDFDKERMARDGHGLYEPLDPGLLPPLYVAYHDTLAEGTEVTHNDLRSRYNRGEDAVHAGIKRWAELTQQARELILAGRGREIGPLMDANFDLRASLIHISAGNRALVETGRKLGAAVNFAGSGGAVVGSYDGDPERLRRLSTAYAALGATLIAPKIA
jgi:glucuronokinase